MKNHLYSLAMGCVLWHFCQLSDSESGREFSSCSVVSPLFKYPQYCCTTYSCLPRLQLALLEPFWGSLLGKTDLPSVQPSSASQALSSHRVTTVMLCPVFSKSIKYCSPLRVYCALAFLPHSLFVFIFTFICF